MGPLLPDGARYELNDVIRATEQRMSCICMYVCMYIYIYIYTYVYMGFFGTGGDVAVQSPAGH